MNLRILKKLSKRADPLLRDLRVRHPVLEFFLADGDAYTNSCRHDRKHWERNSSIHSSALERHIVIKAGKQNQHLPYIHLCEPQTPWPGTPMVGWTSGYETPEWDERTAWEELVDIILDLATEYTAVVSADGEPDVALTMTLRLKSPTAILRLARKQVGV